MLKTPFLVEMRAFFSFSYLYIYYIVAKKSLDYYEKVVWKEKKGKNLK